MYKQDFPEGKEALNLEIRLGNKLVRFRKFTGKEKIYLPIQRHTDKVIKLIDKDSPPLEGDAVITNLKNVEIGVRTADCVPIILLGKEWVGAVHAGWRGLKKGIIAKTLKALKEEGEDDITALVFPSAKGCCYEVGKEFKEFFRRNLKERNGKLFFDPQREAVEQLRENGIKSILVWEKCTICSPELPSYRRDKTKERMLTSVVILF
ncbi:peptidoglycan editing factor PgeF [Aquifex aeolicus]|uniref:Purine nucleoside phosphorylase aq_167 n=1 Tax=Aquifex aeolicus (strain VF5) TaxID=224324 RepID=PURNU_AQUAE|nr:peptidoglycan editing factor PgeF [Aquifex aeolicus]O66554.1 RecName: Full=Purine nucleoside phosphorylase aq_167; AltName: Full=Adenosine deaminase aq_167; AltName: Full=S-methyl-5'-thioadenosine phosphorylase aq_167 [Aquifex aeolicus VF5]AAC06517.1 hypothetical protein aq_167 [Aquifex aeolicus VF5]